MPNIPQALTEGYLQGGPGLALGKNDIVPGSDGAGLIEAVGSKVTAFRVGDHVCTHLTCGLSEADLPGFEDIGAGLGQTVDGTLRQYGIFHETSSGEDAFKPQLFRGCYIAMFWPNGMECLVRT